MWSTFGVEQELVAFIAEDPHHPPFLSRTQQFSKNVVGMGCVSTVHRVLTTRGNRGRIHSSVGPGPQHMNTKQPHNGKPTMQAPVLLTGVDGAVLSSGPTEGSREGRSCTRVEVSSPSCVTTVAWWNTPGSPGYGLQLLFKTPRAFT